MVSPTNTDSSAYGQAGGALIYNDENKTGDAMQLKFQDDLSNWSKARAAENQVKKEKLDEMTKDLSVAGKEFLPEGAPHILKAKDDLIDKQTTWIGLADSYGKDDPRARQAYAEALKAKNKVEVINNNLSEAAKEITSFKTADADLSKVDLEDRLIKTSNLRVQAGIDPLGQDFYKAAEDMQKKPQAPDISKPIDGYIEKIGVKKTEAVRDVKGNIIQESTEYKLKPPVKDKTGKVTDWGDFDLVTGAPAALAQTKDFTDAANPMFIPMKEAYDAQQSGVALDASQKDKAAMYKYYNDKAAAATNEKGVYVDPKTIYAQEELIRRNLFGKKEEFKTETEAKKEGAKGAKGEREAENQMRWLIEIGKGDPKNYSPMVKYNELGGYNAQFYGTETLSGMKIGDRLVDKLSPDGKIIIGKETQPDYIKYFAVDPATKRKYYASDQSVQDFKDKKITSPFIPYDNISTIGSKASFIKDGSMVKLGDHWADITRKNKWNADNNYINIDLNKVSPLGLYEQGAQKKEVEAGTTKRAMGKTIPVTPIGGTSPQSGIYIQKTDADGVEVGVAKVAKGESKKETTKYKYSATDAGGAKVYSNDGVNWVNDKGVAIK